MRNHETAVGILHLVASVVLFSCVTIIWVASSKLASVFRGSFIPGLVSMFGKPIAIALLAIFLVDMIGAIGMLRHQTWARPLVIGISIVELPIFPFGTGIGLYTLWVLVAQ